VISLGFLAAAHLCARRRVVHQLKLIFKAVGQGFCFLEVSECYLFIHTSKRAKQWELALPTFHHPQPLVFPAQGF
jgi:hypothetical protein